MMTEQEYRDAVAEVDRILDQVIELPEDTARLVQLSDAIQAYEDANVPELPSPSDSPRSAPGERRYGED